MVWHGDNDLLLLIWSKASKNKKGCLPNAQMLVQMQDSTVEFFLHNGVHRPSSWCFMVSVWQVIFSCSLVCTMPEIIGQDQLHLPEFIMQDRLKFQLSVWTMLEFIQQDRLNFIYQVISLTSNYTLWQHAACSLYDINIPKLKLCCPPFLQGLKIWV